MAGFVTVAKVGQIAEGRGKAFDVGSRRIAVFCVAGQYYALDDFCPHMGAPLETGDIEDGLVICDRHRWAFRLSDGTCPDSSTLRAETFEVRVVGDDIQVRVPENKSGRGKAEGGN
jgi:nitrite reductase (NADH) small subunit